jgi:hypothetical protein
MRLLILQPKTTAELALDYGKIGRICFWPTKAILNKSDDSLRLT